MKLFKKRAETPEVDAMDFVIQSCLRKAITEHSRYEKGEITLEHRNRIYSVLVTTAVETCKAAGYNIDHGIQGTTGGSESDSKAPTMPRNAENEPTSVARHCEALYPRDDNGSAERPITEDSGGRGKQGSNER